MSTRTEDAKVTTTGGTVPARVRRPGLVLLALVMFVAAVPFALPLWWLAISGLRRPEEIFANLSPFSLAALLPRQLSLDSISGLSASGFDRSIMNSLIVTAITVVGGLVLSVLAAFALAVWSSRMRDAVFAVVVVSFLIPFEAIAVPLARLFGDWGLLNTFAGLALPGIANGLAIFLLRQFFLGIPVELREAARVDGASWFRILLTIYLPLSVPPMIGAGLILFMFAWREYLWPLLIISDPQMDVAPVALAKIIGQYDTQFGQLFAGALVVAIIPALILLPLQRYFRQSVASAGLK